MPDTLDQSEWDVVIVGTGFQESLLAFALSKAGLRILHIDPNQYYGGGETALPLVNAEEWSDRHENAPSNSPFFNSKLGSASNVPDLSDSLGQSRNYNISLAPQVIHCKSDLIAKVLSSNIHRSLEFVAVGTWWLYSTRSGTGELIKVPGAREDLFADKTVDMRAKRAFIKLLLFLKSYESSDEWDSIKDHPLPKVLSEKFKIPTNLHGLFLALIMSHEDPNDIPCNVAFSRAAKHLASIGLYGPGFAGLLFKWGGLAEMIQICCRACAVGGGTYALDFSIETVESITTNEASASNYQIKFTSGETVKTRWLTGFSGGSVPSDVASLSTSNQSTPVSPGALYAHAVYIVDSVLPTLFPPTSATENGFPDAVASVVYVPQGSVPVPEGLSIPLEQISPVYLIIHGSATAECPAGQALIYASMRHVSKEDDARILRAVIEAVLPTMTPSNISSPPKSSSAENPSSEEVSENVSEKEGPSDTPHILWSLTYTRQSGLQEHDFTVEEKNEPSAETNLGTLQLLPPFATSSVSFDDNTLRTVESVWKRVMTDLKPDINITDQFLRFEQSEEED